MTLHDLLFHEFFQMDLVFVAGDGVGWHWSLWMSFALVTTALVTASRCSRRWVALIWSLDTGWRWHDFAHWTALDGIGHCEWLWCW